MKPFHPVVEANDLVAIDQAVAALESILARHGHNVTDDYRRRRANCAQARSAVDGLFNQYSVEHGQSP